MNRRDFCRTSLALAGAAMGAPPGPAAGATDAPPPRSAPADASGLTSYVAGFIARTRYEDVPAEVVALGKKSILDGLGLALAGSVSVAAPLVRRYVESLASAGKASVIGTGMNSAPRFAAFANGVFIHADDFDDTQLAVARDRVYGLLTHPTVPVLPPILALAEVGRCSGRDLLTAYHVGVEVECKVAEAISPRHYNDGFHSTGTLGSFGSAAACARLRGLDAGQAAHALGVVAAEAAGLRDNFGSMTKPFQAGHAAENGTVAADLAALGWTAAGDILEARFGWFNAAGGGFDRAAIAERLGNPWTFASPGISIKPFPCGSLTHPAMGEVQRLVREHDVKPADVERIEIGGNHSMVSTLLHHRPSTGLQAKFSMEFSAAILVLERRAGLAQFTDAVVQRPDVQRMIERVSFQVDPEAEAAGLDKMTSLVRIHLGEGKVVSGRAQFAKGSPANPMSYEEVADKFRDCAAFARWPSPKAESVIDLVRTLEAAPDLARLTAALTA